MIKIEKNIPLIAKGTRTRTFEHLQLLRDMEVGDSFAIPMNGKSDMEIRGESLKISASMAYYGICLQRKFSLRTLKHDNIIRIWRVK